MPRRRLTKAEKLRRAAMRLSHEYQVKVKIQKGSVVVATLNHYIDGYPAFGIDALLGTVQAPKDERNVFVIKFLKH